MPFPSDRLTEYEAQIREMVTIARSQGLADDDITVFVSLDPLCDPMVSFAKRNDPDARYLVEHIWPELALDYSTGKAGQVCVVVIAPEGKAVFGVNIMSSEREERS